MLHRASELLGTPEVSALVRCRLELMALCFPRSSTVF